MEKSTKNVHVILEKGRGAENTRGRTECAKITRGQCRAKKFRPIQCICAVGVLGDTLVTAHNYTYRVVQQVTPFLLLNW